MKGGSREPKEATVSTGLCPGSAVCSGTQCEYDAVMSMGKLAVRTGRQTHKTILTSKWEHRAEWQIT